MALFKKPISFVEASKTLGYAAHSALFPEDARNFLASFDRTKNKYELVFSMVGSFIAAEAVFMYNRIGNYDVRQFIENACYMASLCNNPSQERGLIAATCNNNLYVILDHSLSENEAISRITDNYINQNGLQSISQPYADNLFNNIMQMKTVVKKFFDVYKISG